MFVRESNQLICVDFLISISMVMIFVYFGYLHSWDCIQPVFFFALLWSAWPGCSDFTSDGFGLFCQVFQFLNCMWVYPALSICEWYLLLPHFLASYRSSRLSYRMANQRCVLRSKYFALCLRNLSDAVSSTSSIE